MGSLSLVAIEELVGEDLITCEEGQRGAQDVGKLGFEPFWYCTAKLAWGLCDPSSCAVEVADKYNSN